MLVSAAAHAQTFDLGDVSDNVSDQMADVASFITVLAFVIGVGLTIIGLMKFKEHSRNTNDPSNRIGVAVTFIVAGAMMIALPTLLKSGVETIFGEGAALTNANDGFTLSD
jgi:Na+-transporting NADH:ubiquinone oxidoreductase subunit NqrE